MANTLSFVDPEEWLTEDKLMLLECWSRDGYTYNDVAQRIGISNKQLTTWRNKYPEIHKALAKGREIIDYQVENAMLKSALGFKTKEVTVITVLKNGKLVETTKQTVTKEVAPNISACQTWLYNRLPEKWKNMNARQNILTDLGDENTDISITVTRAANKNNKESDSNVSVESSEEDKEWQESVNKSVTIRKKTAEEKKKEKADRKKKEKEQREAGNRKTKIEDLDYWPDDWEDGE